LGAEMKRLLLILSLLLVFASLYAEQRKSKSEMLKAIRHYQRLMESAQPRPDERYTKIDKIPWLLSPKSSLPLFLNVNTIDDEAKYNYKMQNESSVAAILQIRKI